MQEDTDSSQKRNKSEKIVREKPYKDFPLTWHKGVGLWCKKHQRQTFYFGNEEPDRALEWFHHDWPYITQGLVPPPFRRNGESEPELHCTMKTLCNQFLESKELQVDEGRLSERSFQDYRRVTDRLISHFGRHRRVDTLNPQDFRKFRSKFPKSWGPVTVKNMIIRSRTVFKFAYDNRLISRPVEYGSEFQSPSKKVLRKARRERGRKFLEADVIKKLQAEASIHMRAMILLGINCGFGNSDISSLTESAVDLESGWIDFPRQKTEIERRVPLWPETIEALRAAREKRPEPKQKNLRDRWFITKYGNEWVRVAKNTKKKKESWSDSISTEFGKLFKEAKIEDQKMGFYTLRHTFATVAENRARDPLAVRSIMGHVPPENDMTGSVYTEHVEDSRLLGVVGVVRAWLFGDEAKN